ncbi:MAG: M20/M25/M40 family metallo-hydrolase [Marinilabiliaceae bacterium]|nr:M20/M25/M40 family metallo-hydrolase [Marinilabiliaceae bacterium]
MEKLKLFIVITTLVLTTTNKAQNRADVLRQHVHILAADSLEGRGLGTQGKEKAVDYIIQQFEAVGIQPLAEHYRHDFEFMSEAIRVSATNVVGYLEGTDPKLKEEYIVLGAHYDHLGYEERKDGCAIYNGADDNASGVATIIEVARYLKTSQDKLKRSVVIVAFDAEESGLIGSDYFLRDSIINPEQIKFMFSVDMVGMYSTIGGVRLLGMGLLEGGEELAAQAAQQKDVVIDKMNKRKVPFTDTGSFLEYNIPAAAAFTGMKSPYHKPEDTAEKLDYEGMDKVTDLLGGVTVKLSQQEQLTPHRSVEKASPAFVLGYRLAVGSTHYDYKDEFFRSKSCFGFETGLYAQIQLSYALFLQPEVVYDYNSAKHPDGTLGQHSLMTPLHLMLRTNSGSDFYPNLFVMAGGYYSWHLAGEIGGDKMDYDTVFNDREYGVSFGVGFEIWKAQIAWVMRHSLTDLYQDTTNGDVNKISSRITLGWRF